MKTFGFEINDQRSNEMLTTDQPNGWCPDQTTQCIVLEPDVPTLKLHWLCIDEAKCAHTATFYWIC